MSISAYSQNTKGDRPINNQRQIRETKMKSVKRKKNDKTRDLAGRRLRTKNKSSANRANAGFPQPSPYSNKKNTTGDRAAKSRGRTFSQSPKDNRQKPWKGDLSGRPIRRVTPSKSGVARNNVFPQNGPYVNNPSRKDKRRGPQKIYSRTATGQPIVKRAPQQKERAWKGNIYHGKIKTRSKIGSIKNIYPQSNRFSAFVTKSPKEKKDRPYSNAGLRPSLSAGKAKGSVAARSASRPFVKRGRKNVYWGKYSKGERPYIRDVAGGLLLKRNFRSVPAGLVGRDSLRMFGRKPGGDRAYQGKKRGGFISVMPGVNRPWIGDVAHRKIRNPRKIRDQEVAGKFVFPRKLSVSGKTKRSKFLPGGGYSSRSDEARDNRPLIGKMPGIGAKKLSNALGKLNGYKTIKGGGSVSGGKWNNKGLPISVGRAGIGTVRASKFQGNFKATSGFGDQGIGYSGNIKAKRPFKGGGSVSGRLWNNQQTAIAVRTPQAGAARIGKFTGNYKLKSGFRSQGEEYAGNIKSKKPLKGGGSISGRLWNNRQTAINVRKPEGKAVGKFSGNYRLGELTPAFKDQGEEYTGNIKLRRPEKGGGSISGKLWNNKETPINVRIPKEKMVRMHNYSGNLKAEDLTLMNNQGEEFTGFIKVKKKNYTQNPKAVKESIKKQRPERVTYAVEGLQVPIKQKQYEKKPKASEFALKGIGPTQSTVKASEYTRSLKMYWNYKHNPHSSEEALNVRAPGKAYAHIGDYQGNIRMGKFNDKRLHPDAKFAHNKRDNVKGERTIFMDVKLLWSKVFKKNEVQPSSVKEKIRRPRYDRGEKGLWAEDEDFKKK